MTDDGDGVILGGCRQPQLAKKAQPCEECGAPTTIAGNRCVTCLRASWWREMLVRQGRLLTMRPEPQLDVVTDKSKRRHVALIGSPKLAFCQGSLTGKKLDRKRMVHSALPSVGMCPVCIEVLEHVIEADLERER